MENNFDKGLNKYLLKRDINSGITGLIFLTIAGVIVSVLIGIAFSIISLIYTNDLDVMNNALNYVLSTNNVFGLIINMLVYIFNFMIPFLIIIAIRRYSVKELISFKRPKFSQVFYAFFISIGFSFVASIATNYFIAILESFGITVNDIMPQVNSGSLSNSILYFVFMAILPPLVEEFAIRGVVLGSVKKHSKTFAVFFSALLFSLMHGTIQQIPYAFAGGLVMSYFVVKFDSIWIGVLVHFFNNALSVGMEFVPKVIKNEVISTSVSEVINLSLLLIGAITLIVFVLRHKISFENDQDSCSFSDCCKTMLKRPLFYIFLIICIITVIGNMFLS